LTSTFTDEARTAARDGGGDLDGLRVAMIHLSEFELDSRVQRQSRALAECGAEIDCICLSPPSEIRVGRGVIRLHRAAGDYARTTAAGYVRSYGAFFLSTLAKLARLDRRRPFDVVEVHNMPDFLTFAAAAPKLRGAPLILDVHDTFPELFATKFGVSSDSIAARLMRLEERAGARVADAVLCVTEEARLRLESRGVGAGKGAVVMNSPDERVFGLPRAPVLPPAQGDIRVVYHGGMAPRFGVGTLVRAFGTLKTTEPRATLSIYGSAPEDDESIAPLAAACAPDRIHVAPHATPFEQIPGVLAGCHIGVVPTLHDEFTELLLPVKLMEYVHMGLPVVASRLPVVQHYFGDEEVRFFEPGDPSSLADAIADVVTRPEAAQARAERAAERLAGIAWERQRSTYLQCVRALVAEPAAAPLP
jgi:glycosyltransferase involved in cell wall biosynthesis